MTNQKVSDRIQEIMSRNRLTQEALSGILGISQPAISLYLKGRMPPAKVLLKIARLGNTSMEWLLTGEEPHRTIQVKEPRGGYGEMSQLRELWTKLPGRLRKDLLRLIYHAVTILESHPNKLRRIRNTNLD